MAIEGLFSLLGLIPSGARPSRDDIFGSIHAQLVVDARRGAGA
jgi:hypothetical protein